LRATVLDMCASDRKVDRCVFHQYTSYGGFALFQKGEGLDMDRFYGSGRQLQELLQRAIR